MPLKECLEKATHSATYVKNQLDTIRIICSSLDVFGDEVRKTGSSKTTRHETRIIAATKQNLKKIVKEASGKTYTTD